MQLFLSIFDNIRFMGGLLAANILFVLGAAQRRNRFFLRSVCGAAVCIGISVLYVLFPVYEIEMSFFYAILLGVWWIFLTLLGCVYSWFCFDLTPTQALFYGVLATTLQQVVTVIVRHWFVSLLFPFFPAEYPALYVLFTVAVYASIYSLVYFLIIKKLHKKRVTPDPTVKNFITFFVILLALSVVSDLISGVYEVVIPRLGEIGESENLILMLQYFCIGVQIIVCLVVFLIQYNASSINAAQREKELALHLFNERSRQYDLQKSTIDVVKRQAHDLKHQLRALELAPHEERRKAIGEIREAVDMYDRIISTDNEVLSTILSERSLQCSQRNIRLSCNINYSDVSFVNTIDLYTMLGNALDNAIECVSKFETEEKKTISFTVEKRGNLLCFILENYHHGDLVTEDGIPVTTKRDREIHGIGIRSIRRTALRYDGDILVDIGADIFTLQIILPIP